MAEDRNWLQSYIAYTNDQESPESFHTWVGATIIGTALNRRVWMDRGKYTLYPNMYVVLVAGSARCRKSTAIRIGLKALRKAVPTYNIFAQKITAEALTKSLNETYKETGISAGLIASDELAVLVGKNAEISLLPTLTTLYDCDDYWKYETIGRGKEECFNVYLSMIAGTTIDDLKRALPATSTTSGFTGRIVFIYEQTTDRVFPFPPPDNVAERNKLVLGLKEINKLSGEVKLTTKARDVFSHWYTQLYEPENVDGLIRSYMARKHDTLLKLATILSASRSNDLSITDDDIGNALQLLNANEAKLPDLMSLIVATDAGEVRERVLHLIGRNQPLRWSELLRKCQRYASAREMQEIIETLVSSDMIEEEAVHSKGRIARVFRMRKRQGRE